MQEKATEKEVGDNVLRILCNGGFETEGEAENTLEKLFSLFENYFCIQNVSNLYNAGVSNTHRGIQFWLDEANTKRVNIVITVDRSTQ